MKDLKEIRAKIERLKGQKAQTELAIETNSNSLRLEKKEKRELERAKEIIKAVGLKTQQQLQFHIADITSLALEAVFVDPYRLAVEFVVRRDKTECDLYFDSNGEKVKPIDAAGGGAVDVASFALRIASWSMAFPRTNNVIIMDEPMRFLSVDNQEKASLMIKELSEKLKLQFIIVTHEPSLTVHADKIFTSSKRKGRTRIK